MKKLFLLLALIPMLTFGQITIQNSVNDINIVKTNGIEQIFRKDALSIRASGNFIEFVYDGVRDAYRIPYSQVDSPVTTSVYDLMDTLNAYMATPVSSFPLSANGNVEVEIQDQHTPILIVKFSQITNSTTSTSTTVIDQRYIVVSDTTGSLKSGLVTVFSSVTNRVYFGGVISVNVDTIFLDTPFDSAFPIGADVDFGITNMAVDGSTTTQVFGLRGSSAATPITPAFDITRIIFKCITAGAVDLTTFGDLAKLTNGLVLRSKNGTYQNIFNVKDNGEIAGILYDFDVAAATNPQQGVDGFTARLTFNGQSKIGVTIRLEAGEDLQILVQDDIDGLTLLEIVAEGHVVVN